MPLKMQHSSSVSQYPNLTVNQIKTDTSSANSITHWIVVQIKEAVGGIKTALSPLAES